MSAYTIAVARDPEAPHHWHGRVECDGIVRVSYVGESGQGELNVMRIMQAHRARLEAEDDRKEEAAS